MPHVGDCQMELKCLTNSMRCKFQVEIDGLDTPGSWVLIDLPRALPFGIAEQLCLLCLHHRLKDYWQPSRPRLSVGWTGVGFIRGKTFFNQARRAVRADAYSQP